MKFGIIFLAVMGFILAIYFGPHVVKSVLPIRMIGPNVTPKVETAVLNYLHPDSTYRFPPDVEQDQYKTISVLPVDQRVAFFRHLILYDHRISESGIAIDFWSWAWQDRLKIHHDLTNLKASKDFMMLTTQQKQDVIRWIDITSWHPDEPYF
jgi:hypothetical protein